MQSKPHAGTTVTPAALAASPSLVSTLSMYSGSPEMSTQLAPARMAASTTGSPSALNGPTALMTVVPWRNARSSVSGASAEHSNTGSHAPQPVREQYSPMAARRVAEWASHTLRMRSGERPATATRWLLVMVASNSSRIQRPVKPDAPNRITS